jgi:hypothetical protein
MLADRQSVFIMPAKMAMIAVSAYIVGRYFRRPSRVIRRCDQDHEHEARHRSRRAPGEPSGRDQLARFHGNGHPNHGHLRLCRAGALSSYGPDLLDTFHQFGVYGGHILNGEKPADLPVVRPRKFEFAINLKTAKVCFEEAAGKRCSGAE